MPLGKLLFIVRMEFARYPWSLNSQRSCFRIVSVFGADIRKYTSEYPMVYAAFESLSRNLDQSLLSKLRYAGSEIGKPFLSQCFVQR